MSYALKPFIWSSHSMIAEILKQNNAQTILDAGCAEGFLGELLDYKPALLIGLEKSVVQKKPAAYERILQVDLETDFESDLDDLKFQAIVLADVLEHLHDPQKVLEKLKSFLTRGGFFVISLPNMGFWLVQLFKFFRLKPKMSRGLFDKSHLHEFDLASIGKFVQTAGLAITTLRFTPVPLPVFSSSFERGKILFWFYKMAYALTKRYPSLFAYQIIVVARPL